MAVEILSKSDGPINLPPIYLNTMIPPKGAVVIQDTLANVEAVLPLAPTAFQLTTVADGQTGAITPAYGNSAYAAVGTSSTPEQLTVLQSGKTILDNGTAKAYEKLPAYTASPSNIGLKFRFSVQGDGFRVLPAAADQIQLAGTKSTASSGHVDDATAGDCFEVELTAANLWTVTINCLGVGLSVT